MFETGAWKVFISKKAQNIDWLPSWQVRHVIVHSYGSSVSTMSYYTLNRVTGISIPGRGKGWLLQPLCPDRLWGPPSLLNNRYRWSFPGVKRGLVVTLTNNPHLVLRSRMRSYITSPPWRLNGGSGTHLLLLLLYCSQQFRFSETYKFL
jgi:hypothetical protein